MLRVQFNDSLSDPVNSGIDRLILHSLPLIPSSDHRPRPEHDRLIRRINAGVSARVFGKPGIDDGLCSRVEAAGQKNGDEEVGWFHFGDLVPNCWGIAYPRLTLSNDYAEGIYPPAHQLPHLEAAG